MIAQIDAAYVKTRPSKTVARLLAYAVFEGRPLTTRGRWINPVVFALLGAAKRFAVSCEIRQPIYVIGTGRSGTTILGIVLSMHRDVGFLNEPKALWHSAVPDEDLNGNYTSMGARYRLSTTDASPEVVRSVGSLYSAYLRCSGSRRICDKYPELVFRVPFVRAIFADARFLFLVRNGWDTCRSIEQWSVRLGTSRRGELHDWWGVNRRKWRLLVDQLVPEHPDLARYKERIRSFTRHADMAAVEWVLTMREGRRLCDSYPDAVRMVNFERLTNDPVTELEGLRRFCDLEEDPVFTNYGIRTLRPVRTAPPFDLDEAIRPPFESEMKALGYL